MCGRFTLTDPDPRILRARFGLDESVKVEAEPRFNIAPTDPVLGIRRGEEDGRELGRLHWGLVPPRADPKKFGSLLINARAETLDKVPAFKESFKERRCLIPADGFYEWQATDRGKQPLWITLPGKELFAFAGLWSASREREGTEVLSCAIVTCEPTDQLRPIHDRMPVLLPHDGEETWLAPDASPDQLGELLRPGPDQLEITEVSEAVNDVRQDGPQLLEPPMKLF